MAKLVQLRGGSLADHAEFIGQNREVTVDTDLTTLRVHDGVTVGGIILARADDLPGSWEGVGVDSISALYVTATVFTVGGDQRAEFSEGTRIKADCGAAGIKYGTVSSVSFSDPVTTVTIVGDALAASLAGVWHWSDTASMVGATSAADGRGGDTPKPLSGQQNHILTGGGTWADPIIFNQIWS